MFLVLLPGESRCVLSVTLSAPILNRFGVNLDLSARMFLVLPGECKGEDMKVRYCMNWYYTALYCTHALVISFWAADGYISHPREKLEEEPFGKGE